MTVQITVVPMGATTIKTPNDMFRVSSMAQAEAKRYREAQRKHLPLPRWRK